MGTRTRRSAQPDIGAPSPGKIVDQIARHLAEDQWEYRATDREIRLVVHGENGTIEALISCEEDPQRYFVYAYCPVNVPETHRGEIARYIAQANLPLAYAKLMLAPNGRLFTEAGTPLGNDGIVDGKVLGIFLHFAISVMDDRVPDVLQIVYGGTAATEVLARRERGEAPKD